MESIRSQRNLMVRGLGRTVKSAVEIAIGDVERFTVGSAVGVSAVFMVGVTVDFTVSITGRFYSRFTVGYTTIVGSRSEYTVRGRGFGKVCSKLYCSFFSSFFS